MARTRIRRVLGLGMLAACSLGLAQPSDTGKVLKSIAPIEQPDAQRVRAEMWRLLQAYPPSLRSVLALDPSLLGNESYLAPYPALVSFLNGHLEVARNPSFFIGDAPSPQDHTMRAYDMWSGVLNDMTTIAGFAMAMGLLIWLIRTLVDYRRWNRLTRSQAEFHTKLMDRFTANNDLLAYIESPAGSRFLQSTPIALDAGPRSVGAPLGRILWSVQGGVVLVAGGIGLWVVSGRVADDASQPLHALGVIGIALGLGFTVSAIISFIISRRLGLIGSPVSGPPSGERSGARE